MRESWRVIRNATRKPDQSMHPHGRLYLVGAWVLVPGRGAFYRCLASPGWIAPSIVILLRDRLLQTSLQDKLNVLTRRGEGVGLARLHIHS